MEGRPFAGILRGLAERYAAHLRTALGDRLVSVVLFGSVARGDAGPSSDIALLIVAEGLPSGHFARKQLLATADAAFERGVEEAASHGIEARLARIVRTPAEAARVIPLDLDLTEDGVLLHDRGGFFAAVLERVRGSLRRLGARRVRQGRRWSWDLKPDFERGEIVEI